MSTTYLITGANRGIGLELVKTLAKNENNLIYATARDVEKAGTLRALGDNVKVIQLDVLQLLEKIKKLLLVLGDAPIDVVFQNAGILLLGGASSLVTDLDNWSEHFEVNTLGSIKLYKAVFPYWSKPTKATKKFVFTSSIAGSIGAGASMPCLGYGLSKVGVNFFCREIANEHATLFPSDEGITNSITITIHPGVVATDMGTPLIEEYGLPFLTTEESVLAIVKLVENLKHLDNGTFKDHDGASHPW